MTSRVDTAIGYRRKKLLPHATFFLEIPSPNVYTQRGSLNRKRRGHGKCMFLRNEPILVLRIFAWIYQSERHLEPAASCPSFGFVFGKMGLFFGRIRFAEAQLQLR